MEQSEKTLDMIVNLCKNRGYVFPGSEIYGGLANSWGLRSAGRRVQEQCQKGMAEEIRAGEPL
mgnify:CR=1 FL=1